GKCGTHATARRSSSAAARRVAELVVNASAITPCSWVAVVMRWRASPELIVPRCRSQVRAWGAPCAGPWQGCAAWVDWSVLSSGQSHTVSGRSCRAELAGVGFGLLALVMSDDP